jgi:PAS domain S-box-containing protein
MGAEEFRILVENSPDAIVRYDRQCRRIYVNPVVERIAGKPAALLIGKTPVEAFVGSPEIGAQILAAVAQVFNQVAAQEIEISWMAQDGGMRYSQARFVPEYDPAGEVKSVLGITRDITTLRKTEAQLLQTHKLECIATQARGVAHGFNNILAVIGGYSELLRFSIDADDKRHRYVREISASVERGAELTRSLLASNSKHEPHTQVDDLNRVVADQSRPYL